MKVVGGRGRQPHCLVVVIHPWLDKKQGGSVYILYTLSTTDFTLGGKEEEGRLWDLERAAFTALAHGVSSAINFRSVFRGRHNEIHITTSLLVVY